MLLADARRLTIFFHHSFAQLALLKPDRMLLRRGLRRARGVSQDVAKCPKMSQKKKILAGNRVVDHEVENARFGEFRDVGKRDRFFAGWHR